MVSSSDASGSYRMAGNLILVALLVFHATWIVGVLAGMATVAAALVGVPLWLAFMVASVCCQVRGDRLDRSVA